MQLYALDSSKKFISATSAIKQLDYQCLECQRTVRLRKGMHRTPHFYHLSPNQACYLSGKTIEHLQVQEHLLNYLPFGECVLEQRFPEINRIADVAWHPHKIIFEVQCSPISPDELLQRNADYASQGYQVVWILHDRRYNQWRMSEAELALSSHPYYFTNIDEEGIGMIYDQFDLASNGFRKSILYRTPIDVTQPIKIKEVLQTVRNKTNPTPQFIQKRLDSWQVAFAGDLIEIVTTSQNSEYQKLVLNWCKSEKIFFKKFNISFNTNPVILFLKQLMEHSKRIYLIALQIYVEKSCK